MTSGAAETTGSIWVDPDDLDPDWRPPSRLSLVPRWVKVLTPGVAVLLVSSIVFGLHGFRRAGDIETRVPTGTTIVTGTMRITPRLAEWSWDQHAKAWTLSVSASCSRVELVDGSPEVPTYQLDDAIYAGRPNTRAVSTQTLVNLGENVRGQSHTDYSSVTPGAPPIPCSIDFEFDPVATTGKGPRPDQPGGDQPESEIILLVFDLSYRSEDLSQQGGSRWVPGSKATTMRVPAVVREPYSEGD
ncbi:hypothetical protein ACSDQ9_13755 [Aestuariimicrobium soli]|uniref:hypothetical protein n=1 Tax=Aestuariimicrobium soli TaxID=2035834 RepID=UPI003EBF89BC